MNHKIKSLAVLITVLIITITLGFSYALAESNFNIRSARIIEDTEKDYAVYVSYEINLSKDYAVLKLQFLVTNINTGDIVASKVLTVSSYTANTTLVQTVRLPFDKDQFPEVETGGKLSLTANLYKEDLSSENLLASDSETVTSPFGVENENEEDEGIGLGGWTLIILSFIGFGVILLVFLVILRIGLLKTLSAPLLNSPKDKD